MFLRHSSRLSEFKNTLSKNIFRSHKKHLLTLC
nr:MAG TPA: hypothetical protein [Caudoviricetes sp.]